MPFNILALTGEQIRAARALSRIEQTELAKRSGLSIETIKRLERIRGPVEANARTLRAIQDAFHGLGVKFDGDPTGRIGVSLSTAIVRHKDPIRPAETATPSRLRRLVFHSKLVRHEQESLRPTLAYINAEAETLHAGMNVGGVIFVREGQLLQVLEGERDTVHAVYRAISSYPQHHDIRLIDDSPVAQRIHEDFTFCCGLFSGDAESFKTSGAVRAFDPQRLTPQAASTLLESACALQNTFPRNRRGTPGACRLASTCLDSTCGSQRHAPQRHAPQAH